MAVTWSVTIHVCVYVYLLIKTWKKRSLGNVFRNYFDAIENTVQDWSTLVLTFVLPLQATILTLEGANWDRADVFVWICGYGDFVKVGAQNTSKHRKGALTGECTVSLDFMLSTLYLQALLLCHVRILLAVSIGGILSRMPDVVHFLLIHRYIWYYISDRSQAGGYEHCGKLRKLESRPPKPS